MSLTLYLAVRKGTVQVKGDTVIEKRKKKKVKIKGCLIEVK